MNPISTEVMAIVIIAVVAILTIRVGRARLNIGGRDLRFLLRLLRAHPFMLVAGPERAHLFFMYMHTPSRV